MEVEKALVLLTQWKKHKQQQTGSWQPPNYVNNTTPENITEPKQSAFRKAILWNTLKSIYWIKSLNDCMWTLCVLFYYWNVPSLLLQSQFVKSTLNLLNRYWHVQCASVPVVWNNMEISKQQQDVLSFRRDRADINNNLYSQESVL